MQIMSELFCARVGLQCYVNFYSCLLSFSYYVNATVAVCQLCNKGVSP